MEWFVESAVRRAPPLPSEVRERLRVLLSAAPAGWVFVCPRCGKGSAHPDDRRHGWCGACRAFTAEPAV